ncbi:hypothetical protein P4O66_006039, partial [Electrophorus voltai]
MLALKLKEVELEIKRQEREMELLRVWALQLEVEKADKEAAIQSQSMGPEGPIPRPGSYPRLCQLARLTAARKLSDVVPLKGTLMCDVPVGDDAPVFAVPKEKVVPIVPDPEIPALVSQKELAVAQKANSTLLHCFTLADKQGEKTIGYT